MHTFRRLADKRSALCTLHSFRLLLMSGRDMPVKTRTFSVLRNGTILYTQRLRFRQEEELKNMFHAPHKSIARLKKIDCGTKRQRTPVVW